MMKSDSLAALLSSLGSLLAGIGGAKGLILIITAASSLGFGSCKWSRANQAEQQVQNVIEGQQILVNRQEEIKHECPKCICPKPRDIIYR